MNRILLVVTALCAVSGLGSGCASVAGPAVGALMGGPSLTGKVYKSSIPTATKVIATPFTLAGGAIAGIPLGFWNGFFLDRELIKGPDHPRAVTALDKYIDPFGGFSDKQD